MTDDQNKRLEIHHYVLAIFLLLLNGIAFISHGWSCFATITERPGLNGSMYAYYELTRTQFALYNGIICLLIACNSIGIFIYLLYKNRKKLAGCFWQFLILYVLIILAELYMNSRFVGKG